MADQRVSPTAWYTAAVWAQRDLASPALAAATPRAARWAVSAHARLARLVGLPRLDDALEERHRTLDAWVLAACEDPRVRQVLEVPAGLASRAQRLLDAVPELVVVEGDLPVMVRAKKAALGPLRPQHHVVEVDLLATEGPRTPAAVAERLLNANQPLIAVMEGLTYYLTDPQLGAALAALRRAVGDQPGSLLLLDAFVTDCGPAVAQRWARRSTGLRLPGLQRSGAHLQALAQQAGWRRTSPPGLLGAPPARPPLLQVLGFRPAV